MHMMYKNIGNIRVIALFMIFNTHDNFLSKFHLFRIYLERYEFV